VKQEWIANCQQHDIQLMEVGDDEGLITELQQTVKNVGLNEWVTGGDWSGALQWMEGKGEYHDDDCGRPDRL
jgi:hypothetical protein